jgi:hypothetical protein
MATPGRAEMLDDGYDEKTVLIAFHPDLVLKGEVVRKGTGGEDGYSGERALDAVPQAGGTIP